MSQLNITQLHRNPGLINQLDSKQRNEVKREVVREMVGQVFFGQILKMARNSAFKSDLMHGGRGEDIFGAQLDAEFAHQLGQKMNNQLTESIYRRVSKRAGS